LEKRCPSASADLVVPGLAKRIELVLDDFIGVVVAFVHLSERLQGIIVSILADEPGETSQSFDARCRSGEAKCCTIVAIRE
jgi:hypothetical protein